MTQHELVDKVLELEVRIFKLEKSTSLFHETPKVPGGWCQICGMEKADCIHGGSAA